MEGERSGLVARLRLSLAPAAVPDLALAAVDDEPARFITPGLTGVTEEGVPVPDGLVRDRVGFAPGSNFHGSCRGMVIVVTEILPSVPRHL